MRFTSELISKAWEMRREAAKETGWPVMWISWSWAISAAKKGLQVHVVEFKSAKTGTPVKVTITPGEFNMVVEAGSYKVETAIETDGKGLPREFKVQGFVARLGRVGLTADQFAEIKKHYAPPKIEGNGSVYVSNHGQGVWMGREEAAEIRGF